jgi:hypothetical protein
MYANDPYLGINWVFPEDSPLFPEDRLQTSFYVYDTKIETLRSPWNSITEIQEALGTLRIILRSFYI